MRKRMERRERRYGGKEEGMSRDGNMCEEAEVEDEEDKLDEEGRKRGRRGRKGSWTRSSGRALRIELYTHVN